MGLCALALLSCTGVEGDVLALRPTPEFVNKVDAGPPMPPPGPPSCTPQMINTMSCIEAAVWRLKAQDVCASFGLVIGSLKVQGPCGMAMVDGYGVSFECCTALPVPVCTQRFQGDMMTCREAKTCATNHRRTT